MDSTNYFTYAVPAFILGMLLEAGITLWQKRPVYSLGDTFANLACGMGSQLGALFLAALGLGAYGLVYDRWRLFDLEPHGVVTWTLALVGVDLAYYWFHRMSHTVNFLWASHVVHHQSEEYNLSVALRQSWFGGAFSWPFYLPLALIGVPPTLWLVSYSLNLLYQFVIHTKAVKTLGPLDLVLNTPSHHRVHHGSNVEYLDKNYAGALIVWDRLFGTFTPEAAPVEYGLVKPLCSFNPVWANVHYWVELYAAARALPGWRNKLLLWVKNPGWQPGDRSILDATERAKGRVYQKFTRPVRMGDAAYVALQLVAALVGTVAVMAYGAELSGAQLGLIYGAILSSMLLWNALLAGENWARAAEGLRLPLLLAAALWVLPGAAPAWALPATIAFLLACAAGIVAAHERTSLPAHRRLP